MTTRTGRYNGKYGDQGEQLANKMGLDLSEQKCTRCKHTIILGGGVYFRPKDGSWKVFCRFDCAQLHVGKNAKLYDREQYAAQVVNNAIKSK